jgi:Flp pilus assembly protein TadD
MVGLYWQRQRDWHKALAEFSAAAQLDPRAAVWQMSLGDVYVQLGDLVKALAFYQSAVDLAPKDVQTWRALALFSVENDVDVDGTGRAAALRAYALEPKNPQNMDILGRALMATAQWDTAEAILKKAIAAAPDDAAPAFHLALLYLQTERSDLARQYLQSAQSLDPTGPTGALAAKILARYFP